jgi:hypothetical protein
MSEQWQPYISNKNALQKNYTVAEITATPDMETEE